MSLELMNYLEIVRLKVQLEVQGQRNDEIRKSSCQLYSLLLLPVQWFLNLRKKSQEKKKDLESKRLTVSQPASGEMKEESFFRVKIHDVSKNMFSIVEVLGNPIPEGSLLFKDMQLQLKSGNRKLIILHAYYEEEADAIFERLSHFSDYDIVLTTSKPGIQARFASLFSADRAASFLVENKGRDVLPFLYVLQVLKLDSYTHFVKIHTKRSPHFESGYAWSRSNIESLIGQKKMTDAFFEKVDSAKTNIYGLDRFPIQNYLENNRNWLTFLLQVPPDNVVAYFSPGTMFLGSVEFLKRLGVCCFHRLKFEEEAGQLDGCLQHSLERYFGYFCDLQGGECKRLADLVDK